MQKQVGGLCLGYAAIACERQRIDAVERQVIAAPD
jgi:hypothetical protein